MTQALLAIARKRKNLARFSTRIDLALERLFSDLHESALDMGLSHEDALGALERFDLDVAQWYDDWVSSQDPE